jgi:hypothetical protein
MSLIEDEGKPSLIKLLRGEDITLLKQDRRGLATWIALKFFVSDAIVPDDAVFDQLARADFKTSRKIPRELQIFIGAHDSPEWHIGYQRQTIRGYLGELLATKTVEFAKSQNIQSTAFGVGRLFSVIFASAVPNIKLNGSIGVFLLMRQLWPLRGKPIVWPLPSIPDDNLAILARPLRDLARSARWIRV